MSQRAPIKRTLELIIDQALSKLCESVYSRVAICFLVVTSVACSSEEAPALGTARDVHSVAELSLVVAVPRHAPATMTADALLYRYQDLDPAAARVIAGARRPTLDSLPLGQCQLVDPKILYPDALSSTSVDSAIEMLDAGEMVLYAGGLVGRLSPRYVPRALTFVSGVAYETVTTDQVISTVLSSDRAPVYASAFGGENVGRFDAHGELPRLPQLTRVGDLSFFAEPVLLDRGHDLVVGWTSEARAPDERTLLALTWGDDGAGIYCRPVETGRFVIPRNFVEKVPADEGVALRVEHQRQVDLDAAKLDTGTVVLGIADVLAVKSRAAP